MIIRFLWDLHKDNYDLKHQSLSDNFFVIVQHLNDFAYDGEGKVTVLDKRSFNLYKQGSNQIINFHYSTGSLTITWRYKYLHKEVEHSKTFDEVRNISLIQQERMAEQTIKEMIPIIQAHQLSVLSGN